jgi:dinuclear metal center YbgI/SA1388 family protein
MKSLDSPKLISLLEKMAPPALAAVWDNTGLLLESPTQGPIKKILLTLDLTPAVTHEAIQQKVDFIIAYHPPIFSGLKTLTRQHPMTASLLDLLAAGIQVYSPHTALDAAPEGLSDWLISVFPEALVEVIEGSGRRLVFRKGIAAEEICIRLQSLLKTPYLRICKPVGRSRKIKALGLCPGAGNSVLQQMDVDAVFTGEMRHHDMLAWQAAGTLVILSEHGHSERPYLTVLQKRLKSLLPKSVKVQLSRQDREPVELVLPHARTPGS